jgi:hypothetical protein
MLINKRWGLVWVIGFSLLITIFYLFVPNTPSRQLITAIYLFIHPGLTYVGFLRLEDWISEIAIGIAVSFLLIALVALLLMFIQFWDAVVGLYILVFITILGAVVQLFQLSRTED